MSYVFLKFCESLIADGLEEPTMLYWPISGSLKRGSPKSLDEFYSYVVGPIEPADAFFNKLL